MLTAKRLAERKQSNIPLADEPPLLTEVVAYGSFFLLATVSPFQRSYLKDDSVALVGAEIAMLS